LLFDFGKTADDPKQGYGDILPSTPVEKVIVISEILIGYLMGGLLIAILAKRVIG